MYELQTLPILQYTKTVCAQLKLSRTLSYNTFIQNKSIPPFYYNPSLIVDRFNPLKLHIMWKANLYWKQLDWSCHKKYDIYHLSKRVEIIYFVNQFILYPKLKKKLLRKVSETMTYHILWPIFFEGLRSAYMKGNAYYILGGF